MKILSAFAIVAATLVTMVLSGCSGDTSGSGASGTSVNISFQKSNGKVLAAATMEELKIASMTLDAIPLSNQTALSANVPNLFQLHQQTHTFSHTLPNLTDNETYLFRLIAYDAQGAMNFCGQTTLQLQPGANVVNLTAYSFSGFTGIEGQMYNWISSPDGEASEIIFTNLGTGSLPMINASAFLAPAQSGYSLVMTRTSAAAGISRIYSGSFDAGSGTGSGTGTNLAGQAVTWSISKPAAQPIP